MTKPTFHADTELERHTGQPRAKRPPSQEENPDPRTGSGYPAGGQVPEQGKDAYGRGPVQRRQAGLPEDASQEPSPGKPQGPAKP